MIFWILGAVGVGIGLHQLWEMAKWETITVTTYPARQVTQPETVVPVRVRRDNRRWVIRVILAGMREQGYSGAVQWITVEDDGKTLHGQHVAGRPNGWDL
jgi:hypothetical protein